MSATEENDWKALEHLFMAAHELSEREQVEFLDAECGGDTALRERLTKLFAAHRRTGVVDRLAGQLSGPLASAFSRLPDEGRQIGPYQAKALLGRGGMGNVYLAERVDGQFEQEVALKVIREGVNTESIRTRFMLERQLLAKLHHPNIARLLDGGIDDSGRPYFAMEVVEGSRIDRYCDENRLNVDSRLRLFSQVCAAVQYAHQNLVVHRDLKPSNILVRENDGRAEVTLMDFGIARFLDVDSESDESVTVTRAMTPEYASPEQVRGESVTTSSDVYSLGVILYELLTGCRPYEVRGVSSAEFQMIVCDEVPEMPSRVVRSGASTIGHQQKRESKLSISDSRGTSADALVRQLGGDLDTIVLKALAKEPQRRYASAEAFLEDIKRYLGGMPVVARPDTIRYRVTKFARRHRLGVATSVLFILVLFGGIAGIMWQARTANFERDRAIVEAAKAEESLSLLVSVFEQADPGKTDGQTVTAREVLDRAAERVLRMDASTGIKPTLLTAIARVFQNVGLSSRAEDMFREAIRISADQELDGKANPQLLQQYGSFKYRIDDWVVADSLLSLSLSGMRSSDRVRQRDYAVALHDYALVQRALRSLDDSETAAVEALSVRRADPGTHASDIAATLYVLGALQHDRGDFAAGESYFREAVALFRSDTSRVDPVAAEAAEALGQFLQFTGDYAESEEFLIEALDVRSRLYGSSHPSVASSQLNLGSLYYQIGRTEEAVPLLQAVIDYGASNPGVATSTVTGAKHAMALVRFRQERYSESSSLLEEVAINYREQFGDDFGALVAVLNHLGRAQLRSGAVSQSGSTFIQVEAAAKRIFGDDHPYVGNGLRGQASVAFASGQLTEAERLYRLALEIYLKSLSADHELVGSVQHDLGSLLLDNNRSEEALPLLANAYSILDAKYDDNHQMVLNAGSVYAAAMYANGDTQDALDLARKCYEGLRSTLGEAHTHTVKALERFDRIRGETP